MLELKFGKEYDPNKLYFITIQGPSSSGKSSLANRLAATLKKLTPFVMNLDDFYMSSKSICNGKYADFDNPKMLNWSQIHEVIRSLSLNKDIPIYNRDLPVYTIRNPGYKLVIIEGCFAFNIFNDIIFDLDQFDIYDSRKEGYKHNKNKNNKVFNILLTQCKSRLESIRIRRDKLVRNWDVQYSIENTNKYVWPSTVKWIYSPVFSKDLIIRHGNFNKNESESLLNVISNYFGVEQGEVNKFDTDFSEEYLHVECSHECIIQNIPRPGIEPEPPA